MEDTGSQGSAQRLRGANMNVAIRDAMAADLPAIVEIYNAAIPGRLATADTTPVSVESRRAWFAEHSPQHRPLWVADTGGAVVGWLSFQSFYGRPAITPPRRSACTWRPAVSVAASGTRCSRERSSARRSSA
jgi:hypothetical protein